MLTNTLNTDLSWFYSIHCRFSCKMTGANINSPLQNSPCWSCFGQSSPSAPHADSFISSTLSRSALSLYLLQSFCATCGRICRSNISSNLNDCRKRFQRRVVKILLVPALHKFRAWRSSLYFWFNLAGSSILLSSGTLHAVRQRPASSCPRIPVSFLMIRVHPPTRSPLQTVLWRTHSKHVLLQFLSSIPSIHHFFFILRQQTYKQRLNTKFIIIIINKQTYISSL